MRSTCWGTPSGGGCSNCSPRASGRRARITDVVRAEFGISQPAVSQHLRRAPDQRLRARPGGGPRRLYSLDPAPLRAVDAWLDRFRRFWDQHLDALGTEIARGKRERRDDG